MKILIGADICPTPVNVGHFISGEMENVIGTKLREKLNEADFRIFNLETPLSDTVSPIDKCGSNLIAPLSSVNGIKKTGVDIFTLANNHIMDHGVSGLNSTLKALEENEISYLGVGKNLEEAQMPYIINKGDLKIGVYACAEHEFSIASESAPGANSFESPESFEHIKSLSEECDYVIVLYHGGKEYYRYPSPMLQKACRNMCRYGADLVICQHSHCIGCEEQYEGSTIVYGQGNFIFDEGSDEFWDTSLLVELTIDDEFKISYIPLKKVCGITEVSDDKSIIENFNNRSEKIKNPDFVESQYSKFSAKMIDSYINTFSGVSFWFRVINKLCGHKLKKKVKKKRLLAMRNYVECEAHRELFLRGLHNNYKD